VTDAQKKDNKKEKKKRTLLQRIVNIFLYIGLGIFLLLVIAFAVSQTSFFRNWLRETAMDVANNALNGKVYIDRIDGTIFTSLILHDTYVTMGEDTLLNASRIELRTSPLQLLLKKIYVRKFEIDNTLINLVKDSSGSLNISKLIPPSQKEDTTSSSFPFKIIVAEMKIRNSELSLRDYNEKAKTSYESLNLHNLLVRNLDLSLSAFADIDNNDFEVAIHSFSFDPNINQFALKDLAGDFYLSGDSLNIDNFTVKTNLSDFTISAAINNYSVFDTTKNTDFTRADLELELSARKFAFSDLSTFVPATNILRGTLSADINTSGSLKLLHLNHIDIRYENTHLETRGQIENIDAGQNMLIKTDFYDTYVNQEDINDLLPSISLPIYSEYGTLRFDTLVYKGKPLDFFTSVDIKTERGSFALNGNVNLEKNPVTYDLSFSTHNLNIAPVAGVTSDITARGSLKGKGVKPDSLNASVNFFAGGSVVDGNKMDTLRLIADAQNQNIKYRLVAVSDTLHALLTGSFDFSNRKLPSYDLTGAIEKLNLARVLQDSSLQTDLNFSIDASGEGFNPDSINLFLSTTLYNSSIKGISIDSTRAIVDLRKNDGGERVVNIISDLADITLTGDFTVTDVADLLKSEMNIVTYAVKDKLDKLIPSAYGSDSLRIVEQKIPAIENKDRKTRIDYVVEFKDFQLLSLFLGGKHLELDGDVQGNLQKTADSLNFTFNTNLDYLKYWGGNDVFFLSKLSLNLALNNDLQNISLSQLYADADLRIERIFTGSDIKNLHLGLNIQDDSAAIQFSANLENNIAADISSRMQFTDQGVNVIFDTLSAIYNDFDLKNRTQLNVEYSPNEIKFQQFELFHKNGSISLNGILQRKGNQDLTVKVNGFTGKEISETLLELNPENSIQSNLMFSADIKGDFESPVMNIKFNADNIYYKDKNFGSLIARLNYKDENLNADIRFVDSIRNLRNPKLKITGDIPISLAFSNVSSRLIEDSPVTIDVVADSFRLGTLGNLLPEISRISGDLTALLHVGGTFKDFQPRGNIVLDHADFIVEKNNLEYNAGLKLSITPEYIKIDSLLIKNAPGTNNGGQMTGSGQALIKNLKVVSSNISIGGQLKVLSEDSKSVSPSVYGDLVISTQGNIEFKLDSSSAFVSAPVVVNKANLTFPPTQTSYQYNPNDFIYIYPADTSTARKREEDFQRLVDLSHKHNQAQQSVSGSGFSFDYKVDVHVEKEAKITFVLSKELNQNLTALLQGDFHYERINGNSDASGQLNLLNGSTLQFLKTFDADGSVKFESQLDNPYLDITATYTDYYYPARDSVSNNEVKVAVKITIKGYLKDLGKNLVQNQDNIAVYYGANNIENNTPDPTKTASDAVLFILAGKFTEGATQQDRNAAASTAASLAGSVLGGFLNRQFGDIIRRVELRQIGSVTKFNLVGKAGDINYTIGGSTNVFQDISQANVKLEYPITNQLLIRLERKPSVTETATNINEMINELGLKYKFEF
jgi:hypothetical protein